MFFMCDFYKKQERNHLKIYFFAKKSHFVSGLFLHPNGLFCVYYLGVYMCSGLLMLLILISVSTTLKPYLIIMTSEKLMSTLLTKKIQ